MKKTIAILLILVIGMVGVFAADPDTKILLATTVDEYTRMAITKGDTVSWSTLEIGATSYYAENAYDPTGSDVVYFHAETNRRGGATITMQALPLTSPAIISGQNDTYIDYEVVINSQTSKTIDGEEQDAVEVIALEYNHDDMVPDSFHGPVTITLTSPENAAAGDYTGQIVFWIAAV